MIKMVACSFYNTLIDKEDAIAMSTMLEIDKIRNKNIKFVVLTNRSINEVLYYNKDFPFIDYIISFNGNCILDVNKNKIIYKDYLNKSKIREILNKYKDRKIYLYSDNKILDRTNYTDFNIYKIEIELKKKDLKNLNSNYSVFKYRNKTYLEVNSNNNYIGMMKLLKSLGIAKEEVLLIIGNESEKGLINLIPNTYIIGNSPKSLKEMNVKKTSSNNFKGVEKVIKKNIKNSFILK